MIGKRVNKRVRDGPALALALLVGRQIIKRLQVQSLDNTMFPMYLYCRYMEKSMISRIGKWGNSLAVRLPKAFADEMNLAENASIRIMLKDGTLIIAPEREPKRNLDELLAGVTEENIHGEWETGGPTGKEPW
jgi:antitoxin MazE